MPTRLGPRIPKSYALLLERVGAETRDAGIRLPLAERGRQRLVDDARRRAPRRARAHAGHRPRPHPAHGRRAPRPAVSRQGRHQGPGRVARATGQGPRSAGPAEPRDPRRARGDARGAGAAMERQPAAAEEGARELPALHRSGAGPRLCHLRRARDLQVPRAVGRRRADVRGRAAGRAAIPSASWPCCATRPPRAERPNDLRRRLPRARPRAAGRRARSRAAAGVLGRSSSSACRPARTSPRRSAPWAPSSWSASPRRTTGEHGLAYSGGRARHHARPRPRTAALRLLRARAAARGRGHVPLSRLRRGQSRTARWPQRRAGCSPRATRAPARSRTPSRCWSRCAGRAMRRPPTRCARCTASSARPCPRCRLRPRSP